MAPEPAREELDLRLVDGAEVLLFNMPMIYKNLATSELVIRADRLTWFENNLSRIVANSLGNRHRSVARRYHCGTQPSDRQSDQKLSTMIVRTLFFGHG